MLFKNNQYIPVTLFQCSLICSRWGISISGRQLKKIPPWSSYHPPLNKRFARYSLATNFAEAVKNWNSSERSILKTLSPDLHKFEIVLPFYLPHLHRCPCVRKEIPLTFNWGASSGRNIKCQEPENVPFRSNESKALNSGWRKAG